MAFKPQAEVVQYGISKNKIEFVKFVSDLALLFPSYPDSKEIHADDVNFKNLTSSLTRKQADAVKRRVNKLNANVKERLSLHETSEGPQRLVVPDNAPNNSSRQRADVRSIFPVQTVGEASDDHQARSFRARHSYSEGLPLSRSEVRPEKWARILDASVNVIQTSLIQTPLSQTEKHL